MPTSQASDGNAPTASMRQARTRQGVRTGLKLMAVAALVGVFVYKLKFSPAAVISHRVALGQVSANVMGTGTLDARVKTTISSRIQERLTEILVEQGDKVLAGQLLARLDDGEFKRQLEVSEASLASSLATEARVRVDEVRAQAVHQQALQNHKRVSDLVSTKISSQSELDRAIEQLHVAESDLLRARAASLEAHQQVILAEKTLAYQQERLSFTRILSPYDAIVTRRDRDAGGIVVPGSAILQIISTNQIWVSAWVDETAATRLAIGQKARVVYRSNPSRSFPGQVARLGRETDRETREFIVDVQVQELPSNWTIGQRAEVFIETAQKADALVVPQKFIQWRAGKPGLFAAKEGKAAWRILELGLQGDETVEILAGVSLGEYVVAPADTSQTPLKAGQRVAVK